MNLEKSRQAFAKLQKNISSINHAIDLLIVDGETAAPPKSVSNRIFTLDILNDELYSLKYGEDTAALIEYLKENENELSLIEKRSLKLFERDFDRAKSMSRSEYVKYQNLIASTGNAWHKANEEENYEVLRPHLEALFDKIRGIAATCNPDVNPYDYCLNTYEPGSSTEYYDKVFDGVRQDIVPLLKEIMDKPQIDDSCLIGDYSAKKQETLLFYIMGLLGLDMSRVGVATSAHPFIRIIGSHFDQRVTTRYSRRDFTFSLYSVLYSCGCVLAGQGLEDDMAYTIADRSISVGLIDGQGRLYEDAIGRSRPFINYIYPKLKELFPTSIKESTPEELYFAVNKVNVGPIRAGSDEVTKNLHVLVRYELEKALMNNDLSFKDLPDAWSEKYMEYLGVKVNNPTEGVLQDILWADGIIGYFPTAMIGNTCLSLMLEKIQGSLNLEECIRKGDFEAIKNWNREHIWRYLGLYDTNEVIEKFSGYSSLDSRAYIEYLRKKYSEIYNL